MEMSNQESPKSLAIAYAMKRRAHKSQGGLVHEPECKMAHGGDVTANMESTLNDELDTEDFLDDVMSDDELYAEGGEVEEPYREENRPGIDVQKRQSILSGIMSRIRRGHLNP